MPNSMHTLVHMVLIDVINKEDSVDRRDPWLSILNQPFFLGRLLPIVVCRIQLQIKISIRYAFK
jgi:hypothetical protein